MKIRIKGNSLRLRLSKTEVSALRSSGKVEDRIQFGNAELVYQLVKEEIDGIQADFDGRLICVQTPVDRADHWADTDEVGMESLIEMPDRSTLHVLIEKDFQCLNRREDEDESDLFSNPKTHHEQQL